VLHKKILGINTSAFTTFIGDLANFSKLRTLGKMLGKNLNVSPKLRRLFPYKPAVMSVKSLKVKGYLRNGRLVKPHSRKVDLVQDSTPLQAFNPDDAKRAAPKFADIIEDTRNLRLNTVDEIEEYFDSIIRYKDPSEIKLPAFAVSTNKYYAGNNFTMGEARAMESYIGNMYTGINDYLQGRVSYPNFNVRLKGRIDDVTRKLITGLDKAPSFDDKEVYRYIRLDDNDVYNRVVDFYSRNIGNTITEPRAMSTTSNPLFNEVWVNKSPVRINVITKASDSRAKDIRPANMREMEVLFKPKSSFIIEDAGMNSRRIYGQNTPTTREKRTPLTWDGFEVWLREV
jgi:hypothetical protein